MKRSTCFSSLGLIGPILGLWVLPSAGGAEQEPARVRLSVDAMAAPRPALRYTLLHEIIDQTPGNAALVYQRIRGLLAQNERWSEQSEQCEKWLKLPIEELPVDAVEELVAQHVSTLGQLVKATRCERCDWEIPIRQDGVNALLPHLSEARTAARLLALEIRLRTRQGRYPEAMDRLKAGFALTKHVGNGTVLIEGLVGVAIENMMLDRLEELVRQPGAPNLYWALSDLPPDFLNLWHATRWERCFVYVHLPVLWEARTGPVTAADLRRSVIEMQKIAGVGNPLPGLPDEERAALITTAMALLAYPSAIEYLQSQGCSEEEIAKTPVAEALVAYVGGAFAVQRDNLFKWFALPYPQAQPGLARAELELQEARKTDPIGSVLPSLVLPALSRAASRYAALERRVALLRCVEAIRNDAAAHGGRLPAALDDIQEMPIPLDPMTGKPFVYRLDGKTAILEGPAAPGQDAKSSRSYEITIRP